MRKTFHIWIGVIGILGFIIRFVSITYSSLWQDELWSMLTGNPENSWFSVLLYQRSYQPPLYNFLLYLWFKIVPYTDFYARLLSIIVGTGAIIISGYTGKKLKNEISGILLAIFVAFNPVLIYYSLEVRFYIFIYVAVTLSFYLYYIINNKPSKLIYYAIKVIIDASLIYLHHFGVVVIFSQFLFDIYLFIKNKENGLFLKKTGGYLLSGILYLPWFYWAIIKSLSYNEYWLKEINVYDFLIHYLSNNTLINIIFILFALISVYFILNKKKEKFFLVFPVTILICTIIPVTFSYAKYPILVNRYSIVIAPLIHFLIIFGFNDLYVLYKRRQINISKPIIIGFVLLLLLPGIYHTLFNRSMLLKQPWRSLSEYINSQDDNKSVPIYTTGGIYIHFGPKPINYPEYYLKDELKVKSLDSAIIGSDNKMYVYEVAIKMNEDKKAEIYDNYSVEVYFDKDYGEDKGKIYICKKSSNSSI